MTNDVPPVAVSTPRAIALAQHAKAALLHLGQVSNLLVEGGVDIDGPDGIGALLRAAKDAAADLDLWAVDLVYRAGATRGAYANTDRWCHRVGGALPPAAFAVWTVETRPT